MKDEKSTPTLFDHFNPGIHPVQLCNKKGNYAGYG